MSTRENQVQLIGSWQILWEPVVPVDSVQQVVYNKDMSRFISTKVVQLGSCAFRQWRATSHCRFIHGYRLTSKVWIGCNELDENGWVFDFGQFGKIKKLLQHTFDHKTCVAADDPELDEFVKLNEKNIIQLSICNDGVGIEKFSKMVFDLINSEIVSVTNGRCWVDRVEVFEHDQNSAVFDSTVRVTELVTEPVTIEGPITASSKDHPGQQPKTEQTPPRPTGRVPIPAPVGQKPTTGKGDWFKGTSWGN